LNYKKIIQFRTGRVVRVCR